MTKKHFKALAEALRGIRPDNPNSVAFNMWRHSCETIADMCLNTNSRFDRQRFYEACGL